MQPALIQGRAVGELARHRAATQWQPREESTLMRTLAWLLLLSLSLSMYGCGGNNDPVARETPEFRLEGVWGGHFPGSNLANPQEGIELHFYRANRNGFIHRDPRHASRSTLVVDRTGDDVRLTFPSPTGDESTFQGSFVDADTVRGRFSNESRGEDFEMDLVSARSVGRAVPLQQRQQRQQGRPLATAQNQAHGPPYLTLLLEVDADDGKTYRFQSGVGYYYTPGTWTTADSLPGYEAGIVTGPSAVIQLAFFNGWIIIDLYAYPSQLVWAASLELPLSDFAQVTPGHPREITLYESSVVGAWPSDVSASKVRMSYVQTTDALDALPFVTSVGSPGNQTIRFDDRSYRLPFGASQLLLGFNGVGLVTNP